MHRKSAISLRKLWPLQKFKLGTSVNFNNSGTPGRIATKFCTDVVLAHRYRTTSIGRYRHIRKPRKLGWNFPISYYSFELSSF